MDCGLQKYPKRLSEERDTFETITGSSMTVKSISEKRKNTDKGDQEAGAALAAYDARHKRKKQKEAEPALAAYMPRHKREKRTWCCTFDPDQKYPKTTDVPLNEEEEKIWMEFKEFDKDNPRRDYLNFKLRDKEIRLIDVHHPISSLVADFAVAAFNDAIEMYVKKEEHNNLHAFELMKCTYLKMSDYYYFDITIEGVEERKLGVYEAKVRLKWEDGSKSLGEFVRSNRKPLGERKLTRPYRRTHPGSWLFPGFIPNTGLMCRVKGSTCRGYDYRTPWSALGYL